MDVDNNDVVAVSLIGDVAGSDEIVQSYQFRLRNQVLGVSAADMFSDLLELFTAVWAIIDNLYTVQTIFRDIRARNVTKGTLLGVSSVIPPLAGLGIGFQAAYQTTLPVTFSTVVPRVMLRKMLGPVDVNVIDGDGFVTASAQVVMAAFAAQVLGVFSATNGDWEYGYQSPVALDWVVPQAATITAKPGGLNRRRAGRGS